MKVRARFKVMEVASSETQDSLTLFPFDGEAKGANGDWSKVEAPSGQDGIMKLRVTNADLIGKLKPGTILTFHVFTDDETTGN